MVLYSAISNVTNVKFNSIEYENIPDERKTQKQSQRERETWAKIAHAHTQRARI